MSFNSQNTFFDVWHLALETSVRNTNTPGRAGSPISVKIALLGAQINHVNQAAKL